MAALARYEELVDEPDDMCALEKLRFFCSLALLNQDWIDSERFFDGVEQQLSEAKAEIERLKVEISELDGIVMFDSPMRLALERGAEIERLTEQLRRSEECLLYERNRLSYANDCIDELQDKLANAHSS